MQLQHHVQFYFVWYKFVQVALLQLFYRHKIVDITSVYKKYSGDIKKLADGDISSLQTKFSNIMSTLIPKEK